MAFTIEKFTKALIRSVNIRAEMHGQDPVPAADIGIRVSGSNNMLLMFSPVLKSMLYDVADTAGDEPELDGVDPATDMPSLRSAVLSMPLALDTEYAGRNLTIDYGLGGKSNIDLHCDLNNFRVNCMDGGTVEVDFRVQASGLDEKTLGRLGSLVKHDVQITVASSPEADGTQETIPGTDKPAKPAPKAKDATDLFTDAHAPAVKKAARPAAKKAVAKKKPSTWSKAVAATATRKAKKK